MMKKKLKNSLKILRKNTFYIKLFYKKVPRNHFLLQHNLNAISPFASSFLGLDLAFLIISDDMIINQEFYVKKHDF